VVTERLGAANGSDDGHATSARRECRVLRRHATQGARQHDSALAAHDRAALDSHRRSQQHTRLVLPRDASACAELPFSDDAVTVHNDGVSLSPEDMCQK
jgi:hypothetical protein